MVVINVNGKEFSYPHFMISYKEVINLSGLPYRDDYTVTCHYPTGMARSMTNRDAAPVINGMNINVAFTGNA